jgi:hypothetical protein
VDGRVEELLGGFGVEPANQLGRIFQVGEQHGDLLAFAFQRAAGGEDFLCEIGRGVGEGGRRGCPCWCGGACRSSPRVASPDQAASRVVADLGVSIEDGVFEILQVVILNGKLTLQGAIGDPAMLVQHGDRLTEDLIERHNGSSADLTPDKKTGQWCNWPASLVPGSAAVNGIFCH